MLPTYGRVLRARLAVRAADHEGVAAAAAAPAATAAAAALLRGPWLGGGARGEPDDTRNSLHRSLCTNRSPPHLASSNGA